MSILLPDSGELRVLGSASALEAKDKIGYLPEERGVYRKMKVAAYLAFIARLKGVAERGLAARVSALVERVGLAGVESKKCEELSKGMLQKIQFVAAIIHEPDLLILDEPFSGLDPVSMRLLRDQIVAEHRRGATILFSTHVMPQAEEICDHVVMIHRGRKVLDDPTSSIRSRYDPRTIRFEPLDARASVEAVRALPEVESCARRRRRLRAAAARRRGRGRRDLASRGRGPRRPHRAQAAPARGRVRAARRGRVALAGRGAQPARGARGRRAGEPHEQDSADRRARVRRDGVHEGLHHRLARAAGDDRHRRARSGRGCSAPIATSPCRASSPWSTSRATSRASCAPALTQGTPAAEITDVIRRARADAAGGGAVLEALGLAPKLTLVERPAGADVESEKAWLLVEDKESPHLALAVIHANAAQPNAGETSLGSFDLYVPPKQDQRVEIAVQQALREAIIGARVKRAGLDRAALNELTSVPRVRSVTVTEGAERGTVGAFGFLLPIAFMFLLFMSVMGSGQGMLTTTIEEKSSRVIEVLLSAVSPMQLMAGKLLGHMGISLIAMSLYLGLGLLVLSSFSLLGPARLLARACTCSSSSCSRSSRSARS